MKEHRQSISTYYHTMVPDLRMAVKVGANSMSNEIRTHLETTSVSYFTGGVQGNISRHDGIVPTFDESGMFFNKSVPDCVPNNTQFCPWLAGSDGLISAAPGCLHQALANLIDLANQKSFRSITVVTIQIDLRRIGNHPGLLVNVLTAFNDI